MVKTGVCAVGIAAVLACGTPVLAKNSGPTLQDRQQAACYNDVQKLCGNFVPDIAKTEACMRDKRSQVSKKCSDMYDAKE